ncbi:hypothetical protein BN1013_00146 [Candidatus Rubidus massiliensis]|nr:hypothetical protein BN1013_00146 [Candidatus Rubidus massiliensis]
MLKKILICLLFAFCLQSSLMEASIATNENKSEKIYVNEEDVVISDQGVFFAIDAINQLIKVPCLHVDQNGYFVTTMDMPPGIYGKCKHCGRVFWITCENPECLLNKR